jgi:Zn-dependent protease/CBS domain-containing protein
MNGARGLRLGRVFGIEIAIDASWIFIAFLMTWSLASAFGHWHPNWSGGMAIGTALIATLLFFVSVLLHELAHSVVARGFGVPVRNITLFLFGGVSNIEREPPSAKAEFLTAVVGPLTSIGLGVLLLAIASLTTNIRSGGAAEPLTAFALLSPGDTLLTWLGSINVAVGVFNLIPGFPLDGGRLLRSAIWAATHDLHVATRWASAIGQAIGWVFVFLGVMMVFGRSVPFFGSGIVAGLWLAFIGWFLSSAAAASWRRQVVHELAEGWTVARLMRAPGAVAPPHWDLETLVNERLMRVDDRAFPVVDDEGRLLGLVTLADVRRTPRALWAQTQVVDAMTPRDRLTTTLAGESLADALDKLSRTDVGQLPVLDGDRLAGMLLRRDIARWLELHVQPQTRRYAH